MLSVTETDALKWTSIIVRKFKADEIVFGLRIRSSALDSCTSGYSRKVGNRDSSQGSKRWPSIGSYKLGSPDCPCKDLWVWKTQLLPPLKNFSPSSSLPSLVYGKQVLHCNISTWASHSACGSTFRTRLCGVDNIFKLITHRGNSWKLAEGKRGNLSTTGVQVWLGMYWKTEMYWSSSSLPSHGDMCWPWAWGCGQMTATNPTKHSSFAALWSLRKSSLLWEGKSATISYICNDIFKNILQNKTNMGGEIYLYGNTSLEKKCYFFFEDQGNKAFSVGIICCGGWFLGSSILTRVWWTCDVAYSLHKHLDRLGVQSCVLPPNLKCRWVAMVGPSGNEESWQSFGLFVLSPQIP